MKDIYELLNETKIDFSGVTELEVSEVERKRGKRKLMETIRKKNKNKKLVGAAAAALIVVTSVTVVNPVWAKDIPVLGDLFNQQLVSTNSKYAYYTKIIGKTKSQKGIDVTFENAAVDSNMLSLSFTIKNNNAAIKNPETLFIPLTLKLNGKYISTGGSFYTKVINQNTVKYLMDIDLDDKNLPENLNLDVGIKNIFDKQGDWGTKFSMDTKDIKRDTHVEKVKDKFNIAGEDFMLDEVIVSPLTTNIKYHAESDNDKMVDFLVLDQDGNEVKFTGGTSKGGKNNENLFSMNFINNKNISKLKLIPRYFEGIKGIKVGSKEVNLDKFSQFELRLNDSAAIDIENLKVDGEYLIVKYNNKYKGKTIVSPNGGDIGVKVNGTLLKEENESILTEKYKSEDANIRVYKIGSAKTVEIEAYDTMLKELHEDEAITVVNK
ncbi:DUF4179 domain-containing protein [Clostridium hydrogenum]|uniref:DUF4179 domain-containing protein n=1 Tax=Clostridium hydrogenum TaxID=2855764 RepID=UPI001F457916|nr:DUF4179 domain-containing protein [Clostridium hydrogenum]